MTRLRSTLERWTLKAAVGSFRERLHPIGVGGRVEIAIFGTAAALGVSLVLRQWISEFPYWFPLLLTCIASSWLGGRVAGWTAVVLNTLASDYFFNRPYYSLIVDPDELPHFLALVASMVVGSWFGDRRRVAEAMVLERNAALESKLRDDGVRLREVTERLRSEVFTRQQAEQNHRLAELRWQAVFANSSIGIVLADESGLILSANRRYCELTGMGDVDPVGCLLSANLSGTGNAVANSPVDGLFRGEVKNVQFELQRVAGSGGAPWLRLHAVAVTGTGDFPLFVTAICEDATERKQTEEQLQAAQAKLAHASRLTTVGELAALIAHEINQPLSAIVTNSHAGIRWLAEPTIRLDDARNSLKLIVRDALRASDVIARIRSLTRKNPPQWAPINFNDLVTETLDLLRAELRQSRVEVQTKFEPELPQINGERVQLQQVLLNLMMNAIEAMAPIVGRPRRLHIATSNSFSEVDGIEVAVRDSGAGIVPAAYDKLFDAFYTTKRGGTGLGLWISRSIIEAHAGRLSAEDNHSHGMCFRITLPCEHPSEDTLSIVGEDFKAR